MLEFTPVAGHHEIVTHASILTAARQFHTGRSA